MAGSFGSLGSLIGVMSDWSGIFLTLLIMLWALLQERSWLKKYLVEEVALGILTTGQYETACSGRKRIRQRWHALAAGGFSAYRQTLRYHNHLSELAYKKHHFALFNHETTKLRIELMRKNIQLDTHVI